MFMCLRAHGSKEAGRLAFAASSWETTTLRPKSIFPRLSARLLPAPPHPPHALFQVASKVLA